METVAVADAPAATVPEVGETAIEKSFALSRYRSARWTAAGTLTAFHASRTELNWVQLPGKRFFAAFSVATRTLA